MSEPRVIQAGWQKVLVFRGSDQPHVVRFEANQGVVLCAFHAGTRIAGTVMIQDAGSAGGRKAIRELLDKLAELGVKPAELKLKAAGKAAQLAALKTALQALQLQLAGEAGEERALEAYFYSDTGRFRVSAVVAAETAPPPAAREPAGRKKRVLIVDDSKTIRQLLRTILGESPDLEVVGAAEKPSQAQKMIAELKPDVITLDIHMPEMDGVTFLRQYITEYPIPTVMISSMSMEEGSQVLQALESGAVDYIQKPSFAELDGVAPLIVEKVRTAAHVRVRATARTARRIANAGSLNQDIIVAVGASTGGTEALRYFFTKLPHDIPPIVVVQHIPPVFSKAFAQRLSELCPFEVKEAEDGDAVTPNRVLIAPGGRQMEVVHGGGRYKVRVFDGEPVNRHKPSVDVLFNSVAKEVGRKAYGIIMTGMGRDGAAGMLTMRKAGARTIAQDEASCVVFGMPKEAIKLGAAEAVHSLDEIPEVLTSWLQLGAKIGTG